MTLLHRLGAHLALSGRVVRAIMRSPALRRVELAFLLFNIVEFGTWIVVLLYAYDATGPASVGVVALAQLLPAAVVAPLTSGLADRFPRERVLLAGYLAIAVTTAATGLAMALGSDPLVVYAAAATIASALTVIRPTQGALLPGLSRTPEELAAANGLTGTVEGLGLFLGPAAAAAILLVATPDVVFAAATGAALLGALLVARLPRTVPTGADPDGAHHSDGHLATDVPTVGLLAGLRTVARERNTRLVVAILGLKMATSGAMDVLFVLLALELFDVGDSGAGVLNAALGLGTVLGGAVTFSLVGRQRLAPSLAGSVLLCGLAIAGIGVVAVFWTAPVLIAVAGLGFAACDVVGRTILQRVTPDAVLARVLGVLEGIGLAGLAFGSVLIGLLAGEVGVQVAVVIAGLTLPVAVALAWPGLRRMDRDALVPTRALDLLRGAALFAPLPPPQQEWVARRARWITAEPGVQVIRQGDIGDAYYVLESGRLSVTQDGTLLRESDATAWGFGEIALLHDVPRTATVTALEPSVLLMLSRADFLEALTGQEAVRDGAERIASSHA